MDVLEIIVPLVKMLVNTQEENERLRWKVDELTEMCARLQGEKMAASSKLTTSQLAIVAALKDRAGVDELVARELAQQVDDVDLVADWLDYIDTQRSIDNPAAFVVSRLKNGVTPPSRMTYDPEEQARKERSRYGDWFPS